MVRDKGLPVHCEDVTVHRAHPGHRLVVQIEHLGSIKWPKSTSMIVSSSLVSNSEKKHLTEQEGSNATHVGDPALVCGEDLPHHLCHHCCHRHHNHHHDHHLAGQVGNAALLGGEHHVGRVVEERLVQAQEVVQVLTRRRFVFCNRALKMLVFNIRQVDLCGNRGLKKVKRYCISKEFDITLSNLLFSRFMEMNYPFDSPWYYHSSWRSKNLRRKLSILNHESPVTEE